MPLPVEGISLWSYGCLVFGSDFSKARSVGLVNPLVVAKAYYSPFAVLSDPVLIGPPVRRVPQLLAFLNSLAVTLIRRGYYYVSQIHVFCVAGVSSTKRHL